MKISKKKTVYFSIFNVETLIDLYFKQTLIKQLVKFSLVLLILW